MFLKPLGKLLKIKFQLHKKLIQILLNYVNYKKRHSELPGCMSYKDKIYTSPQEIMNGISKFFSEVFLQPGLANFRFILDLHASSIKLTEKKLKNKLISRTDTIFSFIIKLCTINS